MRYTMIAILLLGSLAWSKDKAYETGTLATSATVAGFVDNTSCYKDAASQFHCGGDLRNDYAFATWLTLANGAKVQVHNAPMSGHHINPSAPVTVQYRVNRSMGQTSIYIVDPSSGKEGKYYGELPKGFDKGIR